MTDRVALAFLFLFALTLPHSIAAAQISVGIAGVAWLVGLARHRWWPSAAGLGVPMALFLFVTLLSSLFSLEPAISLDKLRGVSLIVIVFVVAGTLKTVRQATLIIIVLLISASAGAALTVWGLIAGRGVEVVALAPDSPLARVGVVERDVIVACGDQLVDTPRELADALAVHLLPSPLECRAYRAGTILYEFTLPADSLPRALNSAQLRTARTLRARGTYSHFVTYAEVLLQLTALVLGLWLAFPRRWRATGLVLAFVGVLLAAALAATFTRASWAALLGATLLMLWLRVGWRARIATGAVALVALLAMNQVLVSRRGVGFYNPNDLSMQYRRLMWEDGVRLIGEHPLLGIGMDTVNVRWLELGLRAYETMGLRSHFHSNIIQLGVERGLLGLGAWLLLMFLYLRLLLRLLQRTRRLDDWWAHGVALGIFGATTGFLLSGLLHYNFGDSEVVMLFWLWMGLALVLDRSHSPAREPTGRGN